MSLQSDCKLGNIMKNSVVGFERVNSKDVLKKTRDFAEQGAIGTSPEATEEMTRLAKRIQDLKDIQVSTKVPIGQKIKYAYLECLNENQMAPNEFARLLGGRVLEEELWLAENFDVLEKMHRNIVKIRGNCLPKISTLDMLDEYIKNNPISLSIDPVEVISMAGHLEIAEAVAKIVFGTNFEAKMRAVWLYGEKDSGKSTVVDYLAQILCTQAIFFKGQFVNTQDASKPRMQTQLVTCQELNAESAFSSENMANMKQMLEGRGGIVRNLFQQWSLKFVGCYFLFCSNRLPDISNPARLQYKDDWVPMMSRCKLVYM
jgi:hypothetical protein